MSKLGHPFGVSNVIIPSGGPKCTGTILDFSNTPLYELDGSQIVTSEQIDYLQGVFVDNADNTTALNIVMGSTNQRIICPPRSQGYFNILVPNPPKLTVTTTQLNGRRIQLFFYNVPIQAHVWSVL